MDTKKNKPERWEQDWWERKTIQEENNVSTQKEQYIPKGSMWRERDGNSCFKKSVSTGKNKKKNEVATARHRCEVKREKK